MNPVNYVNEALRDELGDSHFDLLFDHGMIFEGRAVRENPDRGLFQGWGAFGGGVGQPSADVIDKGLNFVIAQAQAEMEKMDASGAMMPGSASAALRKYYLLKSIIVECEAVITFAGATRNWPRRWPRRRPIPPARPSSRRSPTSATDVPAEPPRDYWEAVQSLRFLHLAFWKESSDRPEVPGGQGRPDPQPLLPAGSREGHPHSAAGGGAARAPSG